MQRLLTFSRDICTVFLAMFAVIGLSGFMRGFMTGRGVFFEIGAIASWVCASTALWLYFTQQEAVLTKRMNLLAVLALSLSVGVAVHQNLSFLIWIFQGYLEDGPPSFDMSHHYIQGPLAIGVLALSWFLIKSAIFKNSNSACIERKA
jgi:hypothetical protein